MEEEELRVATAAVRQVGDLLRADMNVEKHAGVKSHWHDPMAVFSRRLEEIIVAAITCSFPNHGMLHDAMIAIINR